MSFFLVEVNGEVETQNLASLRSNLKENEIDPAVERLQAGQTVESEYQIERPGVAIGVSNEELPFDFPPGCFAVGELICPLGVEFDAAVPVESSGQIACERVRRGHIERHPRRHSPVGVESRAQCSVNPRRLEILCVLDVQVEIEVEGRVRTKPHRDAVNLIA